MKQQISPAVAGAIIAVIVLVVGFFIWKGAQPTKAGEGEKPPARPASVDAEFQKRLGTGMPTGAGATPGSNTGTPNSGTMAPPTR